MKKYKINFRSPGFGIKCIRIHFFRCVVSALAILFFIANTHVYGQTLEQYLSTSAENNPELKAYFTDYLRAVQRVPQVGALPDPELTVGFFLRPMERLMGNQQADIQLMQMFPWFGMLKTQKDEASKMAWVQYQAFESAKNSLFYQVKTTWYELYRLEQQIKITESNLNILRQYERIALIRFQGAAGSNATSTGNLAEGNAMKATAQNSSGNTMGGMNTTNQRSNVNQKTNTGMTEAATMGSSRSGMSNVLRMRMEVKALENNLALLNDSRGPLQAEFNQLLNRDIQERIVLPDSLIDTDISIERLALLDSITKNNPMLKMLAAENDAFVAQKKMAQIEGRPMFGAGITYMPFRPRMEDGMAMGGSDMIMPMVRVSIPIYRKKYNALQKSADLNLQAVEQRKINTTNQLTTQWVSAMRDLDDAKRRAAFNRSQTELAKQTLNLITASYTTDGVAFEEVLSVQQQLLNYQLGLVNAIVDQYTTVALLENLAAAEVN